MIEWLAEASYAGIVIFMILTGLGLPIPEEVAIVFAGAMASQGQMDPYLAFGACFVGGVLGDAVMYWLGRRFGLPLLRRRRWWTQERERKLAEGLTTRTFKVLFLSRFIVGVRTPVYVMSGVLKVPFRKFILFDLAAAATVIGVFFLLSFVLSERYGHLVYEWIRRGELLVTLAVLITAGIAFFVYRRRQRREEAS